MKDRYTVEFSNFDYTMTVKQNGYFHSSFFVAKSNGEFLSAKVIGYDRIEAWFKKNGGKSKVVFSFTGGYKEIWSSKGKLVFRG